MPPADLTLVETGPLPYLLAVPPASTDVQPVPLLCFLHGYDEAAPVPIRQGVTRHGPLSSTSSPLARSSFIVVAPQLPTAGDFWHRYAEALREIVREVQAGHPVDTQRTFLTGFSFGGNGVFDLALQQRDVWSALWTVDPTRAPDEDPGLPVWLSSGAVSRRRSDHFVDRMGLVPHDGEPQGQRIYHDRGRDHVGTATAAYRDDRIYQWLLSL